MQADNVNMIRLKPVNINSWICQNKMGNNRVLVKVNQI